MTRRDLLALALALPLAGAAHADALAEAWGQGGKLAYKAAAAVMAGRHETAYRLTSFQKEKLRPLFGSLVDRVAVSYDCQMLEEWKVGPWTVRFGAPSGGQTFGHRIYVKDPWRRRNLSQVRLLAHELVHSVQYERFGSTLSAFGYQYFKEYYLAGRSYRNNKLEREAYDFPVPFQRDAARQAAFRELFGAPGHPHGHPAGE